jgi:7-keto-8-aminopelargonate synthetase-like enzyme
MIDEAHAFGIFGNNLAGISVVSMPWKLESYILYFV